MENPYSPYCGREILHQLIDLTQGPQPTRPTRPTRPPGLQAPGEIELVLSQRIAGSEFIHLCICMYIYIYTEIRIYTYVQIYNIDINI